MMIIPWQKDFTIYQGTTWCWTVIWKTGDEAPEPVDLTHYTARMHVRRSVGSSQHMIQLTTENGGLTLGGEAGSITLHMSAEDTALLTHHGVYDLELEDNSGTVLRLLQGNILIDQEVTR